MERIRRAANKGVAKEHIEAEGSQTERLRFNGSSAKTEADFTLISTHGTKSKSLREGESLGGAFDISDMDNLCVSDIGNGKDDLIVDVNGQSHISVQDYAVAMVDELEKPAHSRERFTIGY